MSELDQRRMRDMLGHFATGVTVVTARSGPLLAGMTANAIASRVLRWGRPTFAVSTQWASRVRACSPLFA